MIRTTRFSILLSFALAAVAATPAAAFAGERARTHATAPRASVDARFSRYLLAPNGHVTGILLADNSVVLVRHAMGKDAPAIPAGATVHVDGRVHKAGNASVYTHAVVTHEGKVIADGSRKGHAKGERRERGPRQKAELKPITASGTVTNVVAGPRGHVLAVVLDDGTTAMGSNLESLGLKVGDRIGLSGMGGAYAQGKAMRVQKISMPDGTVRDLPAPQRRHKKGAPA